MCLVQETRRIGGRPEHSQRTKVRGGGRAAGGARGKERGRGRCDTYGDGIALLLFPGGNTSEHSTIYSQR